ncbi:MAG: hypothetical protein WCQ95_08260 [Bacteroidota bacterium]
MKKFIVLLVIIFYCLHCYSTEPKDSCLSVKIKKIKIYKANIKSKSGALFSLYNISFEVKNISDSVIRYHHEKCSWQEYFVSNNDGLFLEQYDCPSNGGVTIKLKSGQDTIYEGLLLEVGNYYQPKKNSI